MKKGVFIGVAILLLAAMPAEGHFFFHGKHLLHGLFHSPVVRELVNVGSTLILPTQNAAPVVVDASVPRSITATKSNLGDADAIIQKLLEKNKLTSAAPVAGSGQGATIDNPKTK